MKHNILVIGAVTPRIRQHLTDAFHVWDMADIKDKSVFFDRNGSDISGVLTNGQAGINPDDLVLMPNVRIISCYGVGYDSIDVAHVKSRGALVTHTPNVLNADVANTAIMLMLALSRSLLRDDAYVRSGRWSTEGDAALTTTIEKAHVGIVGLGRIGLALAKKLEAFDCTISYHSRHRRDGVPYEYFHDVVSLATATDYLVLTTPGGPATKHLVNRQVLDALGRDGTLINIARGSVVDEAALILALQEGRLGKAGLDVYEHEPHVPHELRTMTNVILLPHVGSATKKTRQAMGDLAVENLTSFLSTGKAVSPVPECM